MSLLPTLLLLPGQVEGGELERRVSLLPVGVPLVFVMVQHLLPVVFQVPEHPRPTGTQCVVPLVVGEVSLLLNVVVVRVAVRVVDGRAPRARYGVVGGVRGTDRVVRPLRLAFLLRGLLRRLSRLPEQEDLLLPFAVGFLRVPGVLLVFHLRVSREEEEEELLPVGVVLLLVVLVTLVPRAGPVAEVVLRGLPQVQRVPVHDSLLQVGCRSPTRPQKSPVAPLVLLVLLPLVDHSRVERETTVLVRSFRFSPYQPPFLST